MIILGILTWFIVILGNVYLDRNGPKRNYLQVNTIRGIILIVHAVLFFDIQGGYFLKQDIVRNTPIITFYFTSFWLIFDAGLNIVRKRIKELGFWKGLLYRDTKERDSGWVEKLFFNNTTAYIICKVIALTLMLSSITLMLLNK